MYVYFFSLGLLVGSAGCTGLQAAAYAAYAGRGYTSYPSFGFHYPAGNLNPGVAALCLGPSTTSPHHHQQYDHIGATPLSLHAALQL